MQSFKEIGLKEEIVKAITDMGFENPTPIQEKAIPHLLNTSQDLIALAQTGTGKTAAFCLPVINQLESQNKTAQMLVLCPTRELCLQIAKDAANFSKYLPEIRALAVYGGSSIEKQIDSLKRGPQIVIATPGRALDLIRRGKLKLGGIKWLVLDEADEMLTMGFKDDLDTILAETGSNKQTLLFSATMPKEIQVITKKYMTNPESITVGKKNNSAESIEHAYYVVNTRDRYLALKRVADINPDIYCIVFCRTRRETQEVADKLTQDGYNADALHGDLSQAQRDHVMGKFRVKKVQILVATDVAARGLDVNDLTHVINYNLPDDLEVYVHRSGRTGRAGKSGISISLVTSRETGRIREIERSFGKKFEKALIPTGDDICEKQLYFLIDKIQNINVNEQQIENYLPIIYKKLENVDRELLIKKIVSVEFNRFLDYYKNSGDLNENASGGRKEKERGSESNRGSGKTEDGFTRFFVNLGKESNLNPARLLGLINEYSTIRNLEIGKIDILKSFSFIEIETGNDQEILHFMKNAVFEGKRVSVEIAGSKQKSSPAFKRKREFGRDKDKSFDNKKRNKRPRLR